MTTNSNDEIISSRPLKIIRCAVTFILICLCIVFSSVILPLFIGYQVKLDQDQITISHVLTTSIRLKDIVGIEERIRKGGGRIYLIDTIDGAYRIEGKNFPEKMLHRIIERLGLMELTPRYKNISRIFCRPSSNYEFYRFSIRSWRGEDGLEQLEIILLFVLMGLLGMIPSAYVFLHPQNWHILPLFRGCRNAMSHPSLKAIKIGTACQFATAFCTALVPFVIFFLL